MGGFFDERIVVGGDFAGSIIDAGIRGEGILSGSKANFTENYFKGIIGADNQFTEKLYAMVEYHFNGAGKSEPSSYDLGGLINGKVLNLGRHFAAGQVSYLVHPLLVVSAMYNHSFTDGSGFTAGTAVYSVSDEISLSLGGQYFFGDRFDEYWYYPSTIYGKIDLYF